MDQNNNFVQLGVIGGGFMAKAIIEGAIAKKILPPREIVVGEPNAEKRKAFAALGVGVTADNRALAARCRYLLFAVKPQVFPAVAEELKGLALPVVISIMAGKTKQSIRSALGCSDQIARIMPNLPCCVGAGASAVSAETLSAEVRGFVLGLFSAVGSVTEVDESLLNAVTGISGSGPAYVYLFLKSLIEAGEEAGLSAECAKSLAIQTIKGGVAMAESSSASLDDLIAAVSSKGGTTVAALDSFAQDDFAGSVHRAVAAAVRRAEELAK